MGYEAHCTDQRWNVRLLKAEARCQEELPHAPLCDAERRVGVN